MKSRTAARGCFLISVLSTSLLAMQSTHAWNINSNPQQQSMNRRTYLDLLKTLPAAAVVASAAASHPAIAAADSPSASSSSSSSSTRSLKLPTMPSEEITDRVFFDIRVARQDGSTYVRDDLDDSFENTVLFCKLKLGLYGKACPTHTKQFLSYIEQPASINTEELLDNPYPNYGRSTFPALDQATGLLMGGNIASLKAKEVMGSNALTYGSRILPANLWIETSDSGKGKKISHSAPGLLTHKNLDVLPTFGITTRANTALDATHTVFGQVLWDQETLQFFRSLQDLPTYSVERPSGMDDDFNTGSSVATDVYNAQRQFFRGVSKSLGDDRVAKLYDGKLLRRMEVLQVGRL